MKRSTGRRIGLYLVALACLGAVAWMRHNALRARQPAIVRPEDVARGSKPARFDGTFPCLHTSLAAGKPVTKLTNCSMTSGLSAPVDEFQVDLRYGDFVFHQTDLALNDVFAVPLTRSYDSGEWFSPNHEHAFGLDSNEPYDVAPLGTRNPYTEMSLAMADGDVVSFKRISPGTGYADAVYLHTDTSTAFYNATIAWNGDGWTLKRVDGTEVHFPESYNAKRLADGAATAVLDGHGDTLKLERDAARNLQKILTPHGHFIRFTLDERGRTTQAVDDAGNRSTYVYNAQGLLVSAVQSSGRERHYEYQGTLMTAILDEHGAVLVRNTYQHGKVVREQVAGDGVYEFHYVARRGKPYADKALIRLPDGTITSVDIQERVPSDMLGQ